MTVNEVYAMNIQPRQIVEVTECKPEEIEQERGKFLLWLNKLGKKFQSQLDAWNVYRGEVFDWSKYLSTEPEHDTKEISWMRDIEDAWRRSLVYTNYDENLGQM